MAGIFRKIFGFSHSHNKKDEREKQTPEQKTPVLTPQQKPAGGFSVKVAVPADPVVYAPVVTQCNGNGGVQVSSYFSNCFSCHVRAPWHVIYVVGERSRYAIVSCNICVYMHRLMENMVFCITRLLTQF